jgi:hypothetical protein
MFVGWCVGPTNISGYSTRPCPALSFSRFSVSHCFHTRCRRQVLLALPPQPRPHPARPRRRPGLPRPATVPPPLSRHARPRPAVLHPAPRFYLVTTKALCARWCRRSCWILNLNLLNVVKFEVVNVLDLWIVNIVIVNIVYFVNSEFSKFC